MKYDVFISKNTKDLKEARILASFLERAGLNVFESEKLLPRLGVADYAQAIDDAIEQSENLIVLCSPNELATGKGFSSSWVYYEWTSFRNELLSKRKDGNLMTVLCDGVKIEMLPLGLRKYQAFELATIEDSGLLSYFSKKRTVSEIVEFENNNSVVDDLKMFDLGYHFSICKFSDMHDKSKSGIYLEILQEDLHGLDNFRWQDSRDMMLQAIDDLSNSIKDQYGATASDLFSLGQYCGIITSMALFVVLGAEIIPGKFNSVLYQFVREANSLGIPTQVVMSLLKMIDDKDKERISNYYKIIRRSVATRKETSRKCPYCGATVANDNDKCYNCMSPLQ